MTALSINLNKVALIRNSRGQDQPNVETYARQTLELGAQGITIHPRPDQRHAKYSDISVLKQVVNQFPGAELNIEGYPSEDFLDQVLPHTPHQVTFVPDPPDALTSSFGWDVEENELLLKSAIIKSKAAGCRVSLFIDSHFSQWAKLASLEVDRVEFYTGPYAEEFGCNKKQAVAPYSDLSKKCAEHGIKINAGHDLNQQNLGYFLAHVSNVEEVSIGHAVMCEALQEGWEKTIKQYVSLCN